MSEALFQGTSLCVVGNINRDIKTAPFAAGPGILEDGETSVAAITETTGGGGANSAAAAASLAARVAMLGKVGADELGDRLVNALRRLGIHTHINRDATCATGTSIALAFENGARHFVSSLPNNAALTDNDIDTSAFQGCAHLLRADIWFSRQMLFEGNAKVMRTARDAAMATSIDLNWDPLWGHADADTIKTRLQAVRNVLPLVNLAHGNIRELNAFAESPDLMTSLQRITSWGVEAIVVHLGAQGAGFYSRGTLTTEPPAPVAQMVQTTGTGDLLSVCMMLLSQRPEIPIGERLRISNAIVADFIEGRRRLIPEVSH